LPNQLDRRQINRLSKLYETYETKIFCNDCRRTKMLFETEKKADNFMNFNNEEISVSAESPALLRILSIDLFGRGDSAE
ncbi:MAG: hypothetical protein LH629_02360, partial [Ignavibacteria bacterium]|nr:hypothetical protein [Ignavibacteria bacterium]